jgi:hypothetical protein
MMKDVDRKEDTELSGEGLTLSRRECLSNPLDAVSLLEAQSRVTALALSAPPSCKSFWLFDFVRLRKVTSFGPSTASCSNQEERDRSWQIMKA